MMQDSDNEGVNSSVDEQFIPDDCFCPITHEIMEDPVIAYDGHTYERQAIEYWLSLGKRTSPKTGARLLTTELLPNYTLRGVIQGLKEKMPVLARHQLRIQTIETAVKVREEELNDILRLKGDLLMVETEKRLALEAELEKMKKQMADLNLQASRSTPPTLLQAEAAAIPSSRHQTLSAISSQGHEAAYARNREEEEEQTNKQVDFFPSFSSSTSYYRSVKRKGARARARVISVSSRSYRSQLDVINPSKDTFAIGTHEPSQRHNRVVTRRGRRGRVSGTSSRSQSAVTFSVQSELAQADTLPKINLSMSSPEGSQAIEPKGRKEEKKNEAGIYNRLAPSLASSPVSSIKPSANSLFAAAEAGNLEEIKHLWSQGISLQEKDNNGYTALLIAARKGQLKIVRWLIEHGASLQVKSHTGNTALLLAAFDGHLDTVQWLLEHGASLQEKGNNGRTALLMAAYNRQHDMVLWLLDHGATLQEKDNNGNTALLAAVHNGHLDMVQWLLLEGGASINERNSKGKTALDLAKDAEIKAFLRDFAQKACTAESCHLRLV